MFKPCIRRGATLGLGVAAAAVAASSTAQPAAAALAPAIPVAATFDASVAPGLGMPGFDFGFGLGALGLLSSYYGDACLGAYLRINYLPAFERPVAAAALQLVCH